MLSCHPMKLEWKCFTLLKANETTMKTQWMVVFNAMNMQWLSCENTMNFLIVYSQYCEKLTSLYHRVSFGVSITFQGVISNQKHSRCKKGTKTGLAEKMWNQMGSQSLLVLIGLSFGHDQFTAKHCYFRCSRPLMLVGSKILIKMTRLQNL